ncbi:ABC transporter C family member 10 [Bienertia sinuspersici]
MMTGFIRMALSYGLTLNIYLPSSVQNQFMLANMIASAERLEQYMYIPEGTCVVIPENRPPPSWPDVGKIQISDLKTQWPLVLQGISCVFEGGSKIGVVGRTGSGKTALISTLFCLVEPSKGKIIIDGIDICIIGLHDLRSHLGIIPQDPTLFSGSVRHNLDPLTQHTDQEIWQCQFQDTVMDKEGALDSTGMTKKSEVKEPFFICLTSKIIFKIWSAVEQDGSYWSMGQRQLFCLG